MKAWLFCWCNKSTCVVILPWFHSDLELWITWKFVKRYILKPTIFAKSTCAKWQLRIIFICSSVKYFICTLQILSQSQIWIPCWYVEFLIQVVQQTSSALCGLIKATCSHSVKSRTLWLKASVETWKKYTKILSFVDKGLGRDNTFKSSCFGDVLYN